MCEAVHVLLELSGRVVLEAVCRVLRGEGKLVAVES